MLQNCTKTTHKSLSLNAAHISGMCPFLLSNFRLIWGWLSRIFTARSLLLAMASCRGVSPSPSYMYMGDLSQYNRLHAKIVETILFVSTNIRRLLKFSWYIVSCRLIYYFVTHSYRHKFVCKSNPRNIDPLFLMGIPHETLICFQFLRPVLK